MIEGAEAQGLQLPIGQGGHLDAAGAAPGVVLLGVGEAGPGAAPHQELAVGPAGLGAAALTARDWTPPDATLAEEQRLLYVETENSVYRIAIRDERPAMATATG